MKAKEIKTVKIPPMRKLPPWGGGSLPKRSSVFQKYNLRLAIIQVTEIMWGSSGSKITRL
jgi:hypothetical protein